MVKLSGIINRLNRCRILVAGDFMLDTYTIGKAKRISPEAPVVVVNVAKEEHRPGGAGNVILNLTSLGAEVVAVGRIGQDFAGSVLIKSFEHEHVDIQGVVQQPAYFTPVKNRIMAENQQIVRIDHEQFDVLREDLEQQLVNQLPKLLEGVDAVAISDYGKGFLTTTFLNALIELANRQNIPIISDPKGTDFSKYNGSTIVKPNLSEAYAAAHLLPQTPLELVAERLLKTLNVKVLMITRSESGISLFHQNGEREDFPVRVHEVKDVTGAGDTVLAVLAFGMANRLPLSECVQLSNIAAGIAIERIGCARITLSDLTKRLLELDTQNKIFDHTHLSALQQLIGRKQMNVLTLEGNEGLSNALFSKIRDLGQSQEQPLLVHLKEENPDPTFVEILAALHDVDYILLHPNEIGEF